MASSAEEKLKKLMKKCFKNDPKKVFILIREIRKKILEIKIKEEESGNILIRVHDDDEKSPPWYIHAYAIPLQNLGVEEIKKRREGYLILNTQDKIPDPDTKSLLKKIINKYGEILEDGTRNKLSYKTENFKKKKDYFRVKRKAL
ncbi:MAG: hypothetical protein ACTSWY_12380 [Promethearchaeota archaeon]